MQKRAIIAAAVLSLAGAGAAHATQITGTAALDFLSTSLNNGTNLSDTTSISVGSFLLVAETGNIAVPLGTTEPGVTYDLTNLSGLAFGGPIDFTATSGTVVTQNAEFLNLKYIGELSASGLDNTPGTLNVTFADNAGTVTGGQVGHATFSVPEPATWALLLPMLGLVWFGYRSRVFLGCATILATCGAVAAHATPSACGVASAGAYAAKGFSCTLDGGKVLAERFSMFANASRGGSSSLIDLIPINTASTVGFTLTDNLTTGPVGFPVGVADAGLSFELFGSNGALFVSETGSVAGTRTGGGKDDLRFTSNGGVGDATFGSPATVFFANPLSKATFHNDQLDSADRTGVITSSSFSDVIGLQDTSVPEPATIGILAVGLIILAGARRARV